ncbi:MAG TPA: helix-turn-helix domain-containing protein [Trueperaceae bacterium]
MPGASRERFEGIATEVSRRAADLLNARTYVINEHETVIAASEPAAVGRRLFQAALVDSSECLAVPLHVGGQSGEVIIGEPIGDEVVPPRLARVVVELVINQAAIMDELPNQQELKNKFIHDLLRGVIADEETLDRQARILGMDLTPPRAVILIDASSYILGDAAARGSEQHSEHARRRAQLVIGSIVGFFSLPNDTICAYIGEGEIAVLKASDTKNLFAWVDSEDVPSQSGPSWSNLAALKRAGEALLARLCADTSMSLSVGIGRYHRGIGGLARSYQDARAALSLGRRFHGGNRVHCLDALGVAAFVGISDERTKVELATNLLSPLDDEPELIDTLEAFFEANCHPLATAQQLDIHRNTLSYRLDKITLLTGMDPRLFDHAVQIRLALLLRSLQEVGGHAEVAAATP